MTQEEHSTTEGTRQLSIAGEERIVRWLKRLFWIAFVMALWNIGSAGYTFQARTTEAERLDVLERKSKELDEFIVAQRKFNKHQADLIREQAEKE